MACFNSSDIELLLQNITELANLFARSASCVRGASPPARDGRLCVCSTKLRDTPLWRRAASKKILEGEPAAASRPLQRRLDCRGERDQVKPRLRRADASQMCSGESGRIFEPKAERATQADVREMDEREFDRRRLPPLHRLDDSHDGRSEGDMRAVMGGGANARPHVIEDHAKIRRKELRGEKAPAAVGAPMEKRAVASSAALSNRDKSRGQPVTPRGASGGAIITPPLPEPERGRSPCPWRRRRDRRIRSPRAARCRHSESPP